MESNYEQVQHLILEMRTERVSEAELKMKAIAQSDPQTFYYLVGVLSNPNNDGKLSITQNGSS